MSRADEADVLYRFPRFRVLLLKDLTLTTHALIPIGASRSKAKPRWCLRHALKGAQL
jgi:hypothetical protein